MSNINLFSNIYKDKKKLATYITIMILCVIFLFSYNIINKEDDNDVSDNIEENDSSSTSDNEYISELEEKLSLIISKIDDVGNVDIMITAEGTSVYQYAQEEEKDESDKSTYIEKKYIITDNEEPILLSVENPKITGVLVVCEGGGNDVIKEKIYNSVSVVLGIKKNQIYVSNSN
jgi:stage III sporulation protein AG